MNFLISMVPGSYFTCVLNNIHDNNLMSFPLIPKGINGINLTFNNNENLNTRFHITKEKNYFKKRENNLQKNIFSIYKAKEILTDIKNNDSKKNISNKTDISLDYQFEDKVVKCKENHIKNINVFLIKSFNIDINIIAKCVVSIFSIQIIKEQHVFLEKKLNNPKGIREKKNHFFSNKK